MTNLAPIAENDGETTPYSTLETFTLSVDAAEGLLANDYDYDDDPYSLTVSYYTQPDNGTVSVNPDGSFEYTPDADFVGGDSFQYRVQDPLGAESELALVQIDIGTVVVERTIGDDQWVSADDPQFNVSVWVGTGVGLRAVVEGADPANLSFQWQLSGLAVGGYTATNDIGQVHHLGPDDLDDPDLTAYWVDYGVHSATVTVSDAAGNSLAKSTDVRVARPIIDFSADIDHVHLQDDGMSARLGDWDVNPSINGITFNIGGTTSWSSHSFRLTQTVDSVSMRKRNGDPTIETLAGDGLDAEVDFGVDLPWGGTSNTSNDSPRKGWGTTWDWRRTDEFFQMYLMFKPDAGDSIWVPLQRIDWSWSFAAEKDGNGDWNIVFQDGTLDQQIESQDTTEFPEWTDTVQDAITDPATGNANWQ